MIDNNNHWLKGKRVLVTRPEGQAKGLIEAIKAQGGEPISCPTLTIERVAITASDKQKIINLDHYDDLMFVSVNAVKFGFEWIADYWPQLPSHLRFFAVGKRTADSLEAEGCPVVVPAQGFDSEALLQLPELQQLQGRRLLIIKGEGGRDLMRRSFIERGGQADILVLYRRKAVDYFPQQMQSMFVDGEPEALIATSVDVLTAMDSILQPVLAHRFELPLVAASERIAAAAKDCGYRHTITSNGAADESIVKALNVIG